jgi:arabinan endo-1,5-alpha-L-arabinosidase
MFPLFLFTAMMNKFFCTCWFLIAFHSLLFAQSKSIRTHDPSTILKQSNTYWYFSTGNGIVSAYSTDLIHWKSNPKPVFEKDNIPEWIQKEVPGFKGHFWAPDCIFMNGKYYLYYSCSTFGSPVSAIGVAVSPTLDFESSDYQWTDLGMVVQSKERKDFNAIDPALFRDTDGKVYMTYGSFHGGIGLLEIDTLTGKAKSGKEVVRIAGGKDSDWEASYIIKEGKYYYLFANNGFCCKGINSTYYIVMGRAEKPEGPYLDKEGKDLKAGGGSIVLRTTGNFIGPGHVGLLIDKGINYVSIHYYDTGDEGKPRLDILQLTFKKGFPELNRNRLSEKLYLGK